MLQVSKQDTSSVVRLVRRWREKMPPYRTWKENLRAYGKDEVIGSSRFAILDYFFQRCCPAWNKRLPPHSTSGTDFQILQLYMYMCRTAYRVHALYPTFSPEPRCMYGVRSTGPVYVRPKNTPLEISPVAQLPYLACAASRSLPSAVSTVGTVSTHDLLSALYLPSDHCCKSAL